MSSKKNRRRRGGKRPDGPRSAGPAVVTLQPGEVPSDEQLEAEAAMLEEETQVKYEEAKKDDLNLAARFVDRLVILHQGRSYAEGVPADVLTEMMLWQVYGVEARVERDADGLPHITPLRSVRDRAGAERELALAGAPI